MSGSAEAVVLAAGAATRFGGGKLLAPYADGVLLDGALRSAFGAPAAAVVVVTGHDQVGVELAARAFADRTGVAERLRLVHAPDYSDGMSASLRAGLRSLSEAASAAFVFLGDMPRVPDEVAERLAGALGAHLAAVPLFGGRQGHPVLFKKALFPALMAIEGDRGARELLRRLGADLVSIPAQSDGVLFDVDRTDDLLR